MCFNTPHLMDAESRMDIFLAEAKMRCWFISVSLAHASKFTYRFHGNHIKKESSWHLLFAFYPFPFVFPNKNSVLNILTNDTLCIQHCLKVSCRKKGSFMLCLIFFSLLFLRAKKSSFCWTKVKQIPTELITHTQAKKGSNLSLPCSGCPSDKCLLHLQVRRHFLIQWGYKVGMSHEF